MATAVANPHRWSLPGKTGRSTRGGSAGASHAGETAGELSQPTLMPRTVSTKALPGQPTADHG